MVSSKAIGEKFMVIDGKAIAEQIKENVRERVLSHYIIGENAPKLACILVGEDKASKVYVKSKIKTCDECGFGSLVINLDENATKEELINVISFLNKDSSISGILVQLPLPNSLERYRNEIINAISPDKDVDCLTDENLGKLYLGKGLIAPCTATGIMKIIESVNYNLEGKDVVVVGRSLLVGKPVSTLLQNNNATVTTCHSYTKNLQEKIDKAELLIVAVGKPKMIKSVKKGAFVIDVGINRIEDKLVGDVDFDKVSTEAKFITPVPGGVGPLTVACLLENTLKLHENNLQKIENNYENNEKITSLKEY